MEWIIVQNTLQRGGQERRDNFAKEITPGGKSMGRWDKGRLFQMARVQRAGLWEARQWKGTGGPGVGEGKDKGKHKETRPAW